MYRRADKPARKPLCEQLINSNQPPAEAEEAEPDEPPVDQPAAEEPPEPVCE